MQLARPNYLYIYVYIYIPDVCVRFIMCVYIIPIFCLFVCMSVCVVDAPSNYLWALVYTTAAAVLLILFRYIKGYYIYKYEYMVENMWWVH